MAPTSREQNARLVKARKFSVESRATLLEAIKKMNEEERKLLIVFKDQQYFGLLSIGDVQRKLIESFDLNVPVESTMRRRQKVAREGDSVDFIRSRMLELRAEMMPVIDDQNGLVDLYLWEDFFPDTTRIRESAALETPVVIMAGGQGTRLKPITNIIPKALVPIGERPIIEEIIHRFNLYGANRFYVSLGYKGDLIRNYFSENASPSYKIDYFQEDQPLGTAGGLSLLRKQLTSTFFVSNCDILIEQDYAEVFKYHRENGNHITVLGVMKNLSIPYGTIEIDNGGILKSMQEKPEFNFVFNSGMYLMEPAVLDLIPGKQMFHATDLIQAAQSKGLKVGVFPVNEKSWQDIGEWSSYVESVALSQLRGDR